MLYTAILFGLLAKQVLAADDPSIARRQLEDTAGNSSAATHEVVAGNSSNAQSVSSTSSLVPGASNLTIKTTENEGATGNSSLATNAAVTGNITRVATNDKLSTAYQDLSGVVAANHVVAAITSNSIKTKLQATGDHGTDVDYWCKDIDTNDPNAVQALWENMGVGDWFGEFTRPGGENGPDNWPLNLFEKYKKNVGNPNIGGCGVVDGGCAPAITCEDLVTNGGGTGGQAYWVLQALMGFQNKMNVVNEYLQDETIDNLLAIPAMATDFAAPPKQDAGDILSILGTVLYLVGGIAGGVGAVAAGVVAAGVGTVARVGVAEAKVASIASNLLDNGLPALQAAENELAAARTALNILPKAQLTAGSVGAATYMFGGIFNMAAKELPSKGDGTVSTDDLEAQLKDLFDQSRSQLNTQGKLAIGGGGDYTALPHQNGTNSPKPLAPDAYIAGFFSDGKMLLGEANPGFNASVEAAFDIFQLKLVDWALQSAGYHVMAPEGITNEGDCTKQFGWQWITPPGYHKAYCFGLYLLRDNNYSPADNDKYSTIQDKYHINMVQYYLYAYFCATGGTGGKTDNVNLPANGSLPLCFYNIPSSQSEVQNTCPSGRRDTSHPHVRAVGVSPACSGHTISVPFTDSNIATNDKGYAPGWCTFHIIQYQKPNPSTDQYSFDITFLDDANHNQIGQTDPAHNPVGAFSLDSKLPYTLDIKPGNVDADDLGFAYDGTEFTSGDSSHCSQGNQGHTHGYQDGNRKIDCGFTCN